MRSKCAKHLVILQLARVAAPETASAALAAVMASASVAFSLSYDMTHCRTCDPRNNEQRRNAALR